MLNSTLAKELIGHINTSAEAARKVLKANNVQIKDKDTKEMRDSKNDHEQIEEARKVFGRGYSAIQKYIKDTYEGGSKPSKKSKPEATTDAEIIQATAAEINPDQVLQEMTDPEQEMTEMTQDTPVVEAELELANAE